MGANDICPSLLLKGGNHMLKASVRLGRKTCNTILVEGMIKESLNNTGMRPSSKQKNQAGVRKTQMQKNIGTDCNHQRQQKIRKTDKQ